jgi:hypothetical protein
MRLATSRGHDAGRSIDLADLSRRGSATAGIRRQQDRNSTGQNQTVRQDQGRLDRLVRPEDENDGTDADTYAVNGGGSARATVLLHGGCGEHDEGHRRDYSLRSVPVGKSIDEGCREVHRQTRGLRS